jgi:hypothetical protein
MRSMRALVLGAAAVAVPASLALGVYLAAGSSLTAPPAAVVRVSTTPIAQPVSTLENDVSGPCDEPEHRNDPRCIRGTTTSPVDDDRSGSNSGSDSSGSGDSGKGRGRGRSGGDD